MLCVLLLVTSKVPLRSSVTVVVTVAYYDRAKQITTDSFVTTTITIIIILSSLLLNVNRRHLRRAVTAGRLLTQV